jgi:hypothetical protein
MSDSEVVPGNTLVDWYARHITAMSFQVLSLIGNGIIIASFFLFKKRRSPFHFQVLFLSILPHHYVRHRDQSFFCSPRNAWLQKKL